MISIRQICAEMVESQHITQLINGTERAMNSGRQPNGEFERSQIRLHRHLQCEHSGLARAALVEHAAANDSHVNAEAS